MNTQLVHLGGQGHVIDGKFPIVQWLGSSSDGVVFLTEAPGDSPRKATVKLLPADSADAEARFAGWTAAAELSHPNLMRLYQAGQCSIDGNEWIYAVSEFAEEILEEIVAERPLSPHEIREMLGPTLDALAFLHEKGFVHGRIKPSNIVVVSEQLKISADFLLASPQTGTRLRANGPYDAPELTEGTISPAADVWSLGMTLIKIETQQLPLWDRSTKSEPIVPVPLLPPFAEIARECLRLDPAQRCRIGEIKASLTTGALIPNRTVDNRTRIDRARNNPTRISETRISETGTASKRRSASSRKVVIAAGAVVVIAVAALFSLRTGRTKPSPATDAPASAPATQATAPAPTPAQSPASTPAENPAPAPAGSQAFPCGSIGAASAVSTIRRSIFCRSRCFNCNTRTCSAEQRSDRTGAARDSSQSQCHNSRQIRCSGRGHGRCEWRSDR